MSTFVEGFLLADVLDVPIMLPDRPTSAGLARRLLRNALRGEAQQHVIDDVELMVSELVGNSFSHGGATCVLSLSRPSHDVFRVAVTDWSQDVPRVEPHDIDAPRGRGLQLIATLAQRWGHDHHPGLGKTVWFEVPL